MERELKLEDDGARGAGVFPGTKKTPGTYRIVVDYRALNEVTVTDAHRLPRIDYILQDKGKHSMWSSLTCVTGTIRCR